MPKGRHTDNERVRLPRERDCMKCKGTGNLTKMGLEKRCPACGGSGVIFLGNI